MHGPTAQRVRSNLREFIDQYKLSDNSIDLSKIAKRDPIAPVYFVACYFFGTAYLNRIGRTRYDYIREISEAHKHVFEPIIHPSRRIRLFVGESLEIDCGHVVGYSSVMPIDAEFAEDHRIGRQSQFHIHPGVIHAETDANPCMHVYVQAVARLDSRAVAQDRRDIRVDGRVLGVPETSPMGIRHLLMSRIGRALPKNPAGGPTRVYWESYPTRTAVILEKEFGPLVQVTGRSAEGFEIRSLMFPDDAAESMRKASRLIEDLDKARLPLAEHTCETCVPTYSWKSHAKVCPECGTHPTGRTGWP